MCVVAPVLVVGEEGIRHPNFLCKVAGEREHFGLLGTEVEPVVLPVLVQVHRDGVVHRDLGDGVEARDRQVEAHVERVACFEYLKFNQGEGRAGTRELRNYMALGSLIQ